jgi:hypothetical protein
MKQNQNPAKLSEYANKLFSAVDSVLHYSPSLETIQEENTARLNNFYLSKLERTFIVDSEESKDFVTQLEEFISDLRLSKTSLECSHALEHNSFITELLNYSMRKVHEYLDAQICAVFLIDKSGMLSRQGFFGVDCENVKISADWFSEEKYDINESSLVGKTACIEPSSATKYGSVYYTLNPESCEEIDLKKLEAYKSRLKSEIHNVIAVPINSRNKTFGVLRVINIFNESIDCTQQREDDLYDNKAIIALALFAANISNALLNYERDANRRLFSSLLSSVAGSSNLVDDKSKESEENILDNALHLLVHNERQPFVFGVIRLIGQGNHLVVASEAAFEDFYLEGRNDIPIARTEHNTFVNIALNSMQPLVIQDITRDLTQFNNRNWVDRHNLKTFCCFPLMVQQKPLGTLSLYTACKFLYDSHTLEYLKTIADSIALHVFLQTHQVHESFGSDVSPSINYNQNAYGPLLPAAIGRIVRKRPIQTFLSFEDHIRFLVKQTGAPRESVIAAIKSSPPLNESFKDVIGNYKDSSI